MRTKNRARIVSWLIVIVAVLAACTSGSSTPTPSPDTNGNPKALSFVAGSEQTQIFDEIIQPWCKSKGYACTFTKKGSVDQMRLLAAADTHYDAYWFASDVFRRLGDPSATRLRDVQFMFTTPVVFAGWKSEMQRLGFVGRNVTTADVYKAVVNGNAHTWATNPTQSNSGATAYLGFLNYLAGNGPGQVLTEAQLASPKVQEGITKFVRAIGKTPASTDDLMNECIADSTNCRSVFTYEALVIQHNKELVAQGKEPMYAVYPQGSLGVADAPMGFFPHANDTATTAKEQIFKDLQTFLLSPEGQKQVQERGRRPASSIGLSLKNPDTAVFNPAWGIKADLQEQTLKFPGEAVIRQSLDDYQLKFRAPSDITFCLDTSGSMADNGGWDQMTQGDSQTPAATHILFDPSGQADYLLQTSPLDRTTVMSFSDQIKVKQTVDGNDPAQLKDLENQVIDKGVGGGTAIYDCLNKAADILAASPDTNRKRLVVLLTDGYNTDGADNLDQAKFAALHIPVIAVAFGNDVDTGTLQKIATETGGQYIANKDDLVAALRSATSYR